MTSKAGSDPCVWVCTTLNDSSAIDAIIRKEFTRQWREQQTAEQIEWSKRMLKESELGWKRGNILTPEQVGDVWYFNTRPEFNSAPFISAGGFPLVSETLKGVLAQFDLGDTAFHPISLMDPDETHLTTREPYFLLNVCNKRPIGNYEALGPEGDYRAPLNCRAGGLVYLPRAGQEDQLIFAPDGIVGPDIWLDPKVPGLLFLSNHLASGLKQAGLDKSWRLVHCAVGVL